MGVGTENYEIAEMDLKYRFCGLRFPIGWTIGKWLFKLGRYKSESSLMTCEQELHCWVSKTARPILSFKSSGEESIQILFSKARI